MEDYPSSCVGLLQLSCSLLPDCKWHLKLLQRKHFVSRSKYLNCHNPTVHTIEVKKIKKFQKNNLIKRSKSFTIEEYSRQHRCKISCFIPYIIKINSAIKMGTCIEQVPMCNLFKFSKQLEFLSMYLFKENYY